MTRSIFARPASASLHRLVLASTAGVVGLLGFAQSSLADIVPIGQECAACLCQSSDTDCLNSAITNPVERVIRGFFDEDCECNAAEGECVITVPRSSSDKDLLLSAACGIFDSSTCSGEFGSGWDCEALIDAVDTIATENSLTITMCDWVDLLRCAGCADSFNECQDWQDLLEAGLGRALTDCETGEVILCSGCETNPEALAALMCEYAEACLASNATCTEIVEAVESLLGRQLDPCEIGELIECTECAQNCGTVAESGTSLSLAFEGMACDRNDDQTVDCEDLKLAIKDSLECNGVLCGRGTCDNTEGSPGSGGEAPEGVQSLAQMVTEITCAWFNYGSGGTAGCSTGMSCEEILDCIHELLEECAPAGESTTLTAEQVAQVLDCTGCEYDCLDENNSPVDCSSLPCPIPDMDGDGDSDEIDLILTIKELEECCAGDSESPFHEGLTAEELFALLCDHLDNCEGATTEGFGGTVLPTDAGGGGTSPQYRRLDYRTDPQGYMEALAAYCEAYPELCPMRYLFGDEDDLTECESVDAALALMQELLNLTLGDIVDESDCGSGDAGPNPAMLDRQQSPPSNSAPSTGAPVALATGDKLESATDLVVAVPGPDFELTRHYTSSTDYTGASLVGNNWTLSAFQFISGDMGSDILLHGPSLKNSVTFYKHSTLEQWNPRGSTAMVMTDESDTITLPDGTHDLVRLSDPGRWYADFVDPGAASDYAGLMVAWGDSYGNTRSFKYLQYGGVPRLRTIFLNGTDYDDCDAAVRFWWFVGGAGDLGSGPIEEIAGKLHFVEVLRPVGEEGQMVKTDQVTYVYRMGDDGSHDDTGSLGDLIMVTKKTRVDMAPEGAEPWRYLITQYRYHLDETQSVADDARANVSGDYHQLKMVILPEQVEYFAQRMQELGAARPRATALREWAIELLGEPDYVEGTPLYTEADTTEVHVLDLAAKIVGYDWTPGLTPGSGTGNGYVTKQYVQTGCGCGGASQGLLLEYDYSSYSSATALTTRVIEKMRSGSSYSEHRRIYYDMVKFGGVPYLVNTAIKAPSSSTEWVNHRVYTSSAPYNLIKFVTPSAVDAYSSHDDTSGAPTISFKESDGLVWGFAYTSDNRLSEHRLHEGWGSSGSPVAVTSYDLLSSTGYHATKKWLPTTAIRYRNVGETSVPGTPDDDHEVSAFDYGFVNTDDAQPQWIKTTVEAELVAENGPGGTYESYAVFNSRGELEWSRSADDVLTYRRYDVRTGALVAVVRDAAATDAGGFTDADLSGTLAGSLSTSGWGSGSPEQLKSTYTVDLLGRGTGSTSPGDVTHSTVRAIRGFADRPGIYYYAQMSLPHDLGESITPRFDGPASINWTNAGGRSIGSSDYRLVTTGDYDPGTLEFTLKSTATERWGELGLSVTRHSLAGMVREHEVWHDVEGEYPTLASPSYVTSFEYDELGRMLKQTAPNGTITVYTHDVLNRVVQVDIGRTPGNTSGTTPVKVAEYFYDDPDVLDGPNQGVGNGNLNFVRAYSAASTTRDTRRFFDYRDRAFKTLNPTTPHEFLVYDNLDRVVQRGVFKNVPVAIDDDLDDRGLYSTTSYSQRGLVYRQQVATDAMDSSPTFLESHTWYDSVGRPIERWGPNAPATKTRYDALGRAELVAVTNRGGDPAPGDTANHASAQNLTDDIVIEQAEYAYTGTGRADTVSMRYRRHDKDTDTGELGDSLSVRTFMGYMYDDAQRPIRTLNYGTNESTDVFKNGTLPTWPLSSLPDWGGSPPDDNPIMTGVVYNERGLVQDVIDPLGRSTRTFYDDLSRRIAVAENYEDAGIQWDSGVALPRWEATGIDSGEHDKDRVTAFVYDGAGNVTQQIAFLPTGGASTVQVTQYEYGTTVTTTGTMDSLVPSGDLLAAVHYPNDTSGEADDDAEFTVSYAYNRLGELLGVTDQNGTRHEYARDSAGRVTLDAVDNFGTDIDQHVKSLKVQYDVFGRMDVVTSWANADGTGDVRNAVQFEYTPLWQVGWVHQDPDSDIDTGTPDGIETKSIQYGYLTSTTSGDNHSRLVAMSYPTNATLAFDYNGAAFNDTISRVTDLSIAPGGVSGLAAYSYLGLGMFAVTDYITPDVQLDRTLHPNGERQTSGVYGGFDRFGRVKFHTWADGGLTEHATIGTSPDRPFLFAEAYAYDAASNRTSKDTTQPVLGQNWNHIDREYDYDGLDRLIEAKRGTWSGSSLTQTGVAGSQKWTLDMLGNWSEFLQDLSGGGAYTDTTDLAETRDHNAANEIGEVDQTYPASATRPFAYDDSGNMTEQELRSGEGTGRRYYVHDAWNRLVRVDLDDDGPGTGDAAYTIAEYEYNPLHWRTVKVADVRPPTSNPTSAPTVMQRRVMYYDASWRLIEEHICDDWDSEADDNRIAQNFWGLRYIDDLVYRREDRDLTNAEPPAEDPEEPDWDEAETPSWFALTDVQFSVVALITPTAKLVERVVYDPYGRGRHFFATDYSGDAVVTSGDYTSSFLGAWFANDLSADWDRDGTVYPDVGDIFAFQTDWTPQNGKDAGAGQISWRYDPNDATTSEAPDSPIGYCGYVFNPETDDYTVRFRHYDPEIGRWLERDPAGYVDGMHLSAYVRGKPHNMVDPLGLCSANCDDNPFGGCDLGERSARAAWAAAHPKGSENTKSIYERGLLSLEEGYSLLAAACERCGEKAKEQSKKDLVAPSGEHPTDSDLQSGKEEDANCFDVVECKKQARRLVDTLKDAWTKHYGKGPRKWNIHQVGGLLCWEWVEVYDMELNNNVDRSHVGFAPYLTYTKLYVYKGQWTESERGNNDLHYFLQVTLPCGESVQFDDGFWDHGSHWAHPGKTIPDSRPGWHYPGTGEVPDVEYLYPPEAKK